MVWKVLHSENRLNDRLYDFSDISSLPGLWFSEEEKKEPKLNLFLDMHTPFGKGVSLVPSFQQYIQSYCTNDEREQIQRWTIQETQKSLPNPISYDTIRKVYGGGHYHRFFMEGQLVREGAIEHVKDPFLADAIARYETREEKIFDYVKTHGDAMEQIVTLMRKHGEYDNYWTHLCQQAGWNELSSYWNSCEEEQSTLRWMEKQKKKTKRPKIDKNQKTLHSFLVSKNPLPSAL